MPTFSGSLAPGSSLDENMLDVCQFVSRCPLEGLVKGPLDIFGGKGKGRRIDESGSSESCIAPISSWYVVVLGPDAFRS